MAFELDPPEMAGNIPADPIRRGAPDKKPKLGLFPKSGAAGNLRDAYAAAVTETADARAALIQITATHRAAEQAEGVAVTAWMQLNRPSADSVVRDYLKKEGALRESNVKAGLPANHRGTVAAHDSSPITQAALARGRHAGGNSQQAGVPLRSNLARRNI
jgi:hypothetical protein